MVISTFDAAKTVGEYANWSISNLQMQKILYLVNMFYIGQSKGHSPLIEEKFEAWDYGPVLPSLYHKVKFFGREPVKDIFFDAKIINTGLAGNILKTSAETFSKAKPGDLVSYTHRDGGAWSQCYSPGRRNAVIDPSLILQEYESITS